MEDLFATGTEDPSSTFVFRDTFFEGTFCTLLSEDVLETSTSVSVSVPLEAL